MAKLSGGAALKAKLEQLSALVDKPETLNVGFLEGATYPDGTPVAAVAFWNEFGTRSIPARPFFRNMIAQGSPQWGEKLGRVLVATKYDVDRSLKLMGEELSGELVASIDKTTEPPNSPQTIARKGFSKVLVDTGTMRRAVNYEVNS